MGGADSLPLLPRRHKIARVRMGARVLGSGGGGGGGGDCGLGWVGGLGGLRGAAGAGGAAAAEPRARTLTQTHTRTRTHTLTLTQTAGAGGAAAAEPAALCTQPPCRCLARRPVDGRRAGSVNSGQNKISTCSLRVTLTAATPIV